MDYTKIAKIIIDGVGGKKNINNVTHCFTRLRFELKDKSLADAELLNRTEGVISVVDSGGQYQVVIGNKVEKVFNEVTAQLGHLTAEATPKKGMDRLLTLVTQIFTPLVPAIAAAGLIKGLLTAARMILKNSFGMSIETSDTYILLFAASQIIFHFMPIFLAYTTAKALKTDRIIAMVLGGFLVYPQVNEIMTNYQTPTSIFGLPFIKGAWGSESTLRVFTYVESVIPIILTVVVLSFLERWLKKYVPAILQIILVPGLSLIVMLPIMLSVTGPIGIYIGNFIQMAYNSIMSFSPILGGALIGGGWGIFVIFGAHRALLPIGLNDVALTGKQNLLAFAGAANFAQGGAAFGVMLKTKNKELKGVSLSAMISAVLVGITEPAIYGANLRLKKPMLAAVLAGAIGGGLMGLGNVYGDAFANNGVLTIFTYAAFGMTPFIFYLVGCAIAFFGAALLTYILGFEDIPVTDLDNATVETVSEPQAIYAPVAGQLIPASQINDQVFSSSALGATVGIIPTEGTVVAPADGRVVSVFPTKHAIGLQLNNGVELLIHIGINTVALEGKLFELFVGEGDTVVQGQRLVQFDLEAVKAVADPTVIVVVTSHNQDKLQAVVDAKPVTASDIVFV